MTHGKKQGPGWASVHLDHITTLDPPPEPRGAPPHLWKPLRQALDITAFGVNVWIGAKVGDYVIQPHDEVWDGEPDHQELYVVLAGKATMTIDGAELRLLQGSCVRVDPQCFRSIVATSPPTVVLAVGAKPGELYSVGAWEAEAIARAGKAGRADDA